MKGIKSFKELEDRLAELGQGLLTLLNDVVMTESELRKAMENMREVADAQDDMNTKG